MGKVVLQRMELKSPLTVRKGSVIPFGQTISDQPQQIVQRIQTPVNGTNQYTENNNNTLKHHIETLRYIKRCKSMEGSICQYYFTKY